MATSCCPGGTFRPATAGGEAPSGRGECMGRQACCHMGHMTLSHGSHITKRTVTWVTLHCHKVYISPSGWSQGHIILSQGSYITKLTVTGSHYTVTKFTYRQADGHRVTSRSHKVHTSLSVISQGSYHTVIRLTYTSPCTLSQGSYII